MKPTVPNPLLRLQARISIARNRGTIMLIALVSMLFYMLFQAFLQRALYSDFEVLSALVNAVYGTQSGTSAPDINGLLQRFMVSARPNLIIATACLGAWVLTAFLSTSRTASELKLIQGQEISPMDVFSRGGIWLKAIGHRLYLILRVLLWTLPGIAVMILGEFLAARTALQGAAGDGLMLQFAAMLVLQGMAGMFFLSGWAYLRYAVSGIILADKPETGVLESVRLSKVYMKGRMGRMVLLALFFAAMELVANYFASMLLQLNTLLGLTVDMALSLMLLLYYDTTLCVFYLVGRETQGEEKSPLSDGPGDDPETP